MPREERLPLALEQTNRFNLAHDDVTAKTAAVTRALDAIDGASSAVDRLMRIDEARIGIDRVEAAFAAMVAIAEDIAISFGDALQQAEHRARVDAWLDKVRGPSDDLRRRLQVAIDSTAASISGKGSA